MSYIVIDLEWNQCPSGKAKENPALPFEIVEIGAIKLNDNREIIGHFSETIRPQVYRKFHFRTKEILHMDMEDLKNARTFPQVIADFFSWCGEDCHFCTWGPLDLVELQRNMSFYGMETPLPFPLLYYDVQKMFSLLYEDGKVRRSLEDAVEFLHIRKDAPFHRAFEDTYYTAEVMKIMDWDQVKEYRSVDYFRPPANKKEEIHIRFERYAKYVSRVFDSREEAMQDKEVISTRCYVCGTKMKRTVPWFGVGAKHYYSVSECPTHGLVKGKIRVKKSLEDETFVVKTQKLIGEEEASVIIQKYESSKNKKKRPPKTEGQLKKQK